MTEDELRDGGWMPACPGIFIRVMLPEFKRENTELPGLDYYVTAVAFGFGQSELNALLDSLGIVKSYHTETGSIVLEDFKGVRVFIGGQPEPPRPMTAPFFRTRTGT